LPCRRHDAPAARQRKQIVAHVANRPIAQRDTRRVLYPH
jgi:hypothetical protein